MANRHRGNLATEIVGLANANRAELNLRRDFVEHYRKHDWPHLLSNDGFDWSLQSVRAPNADGVARHKQWSEERNSLNVIPMTMLQENVSADWSTRGVDQPARQAPDSAARVEDDQAPVRPTNLHTGGISPVASCERTWARNGAARPPESKAKTHECGAFTPARTIPPLSIVALRGLSRREGDSCHIRTCARCSSAGRFASSMRRRSTVIQPASLTSFIARDTVSRLAPI